MTRNDKHDISFGKAVLPPEQARALRKAVKLEWLTIAYYAVDVALLSLVLGNSQTMKAAWIEDALAALPPIAFLVSAHFVQRPATAAHPFGFHKAVAIAHLVASVALLVFGGYLLVESASLLLRTEHPSIGGIEIFGTTIWFGWLMIAALALTGIAPVFFGRAKAKLAPLLRDRVLYADSRMNRADWLTSAAGIIGITGIGLGWWWADAAVAIVISVDILQDGFRHTGNALAGLTDTSPKTYDGKRDDPLRERIDDYLRELDWVDAAKSRIREKGHIFQIESFVVPKTGGTVSIEKLREAREGCTQLDWKVQDMVIVPVEALPGEFLPGEGSATTG